ncbi:MAG: MSHA biogenesis protein MshM [Arenicella sp.]|jgi:type II secretory pathway predicted ATPase ExeA
MIKSVFGLTKEPFHRQGHALLDQQKNIADIIKIHAQQGGFSVVVGEPGVGKSVLREHLETLQNEREVTVVSCSQTLHTYFNILKQPAESFKIDVPINHLEKELINSAFNHIRQRKTLYTLIDEAHSLDMIVLRKLRLLFDRFPKKHNLVLFGQRDLLYYLSLNVNQDIKSRITYSASILRLNDDDLEHYIVKELEAVRLGINTFDSAAVELILRSAQGNLRLCRNLCYGSLIEACREAKKVVSITHVNAVLVQPHWRSHDELIKQQAT